jgi:RNA polymerase sigma-70 factor (ECF subfamily)
MKAAAIAVRPGALEVLRHAITTAFGTVGTGAVGIYTGDMTANDLPADGDDRDIALSRRGDDDAFGRLVARHQQDIAGLMARFTPDRLKLEELVQDVFVEAWKSLPTFQRGRPFRPWLRTVAVHVGYRYWKGLKRERSNVSLDDIADVAAREEILPPERAEELLHSLLGSLRPRDRLVLTLMYVEGHSIAETAELTGWSKLMVKVQAHRARGKLRKLIEKAVPEGMRP